MMCWEGIRIAKFMGPTWGPHGYCRPQMDAMLAPWTSLSGKVHVNAITHAWLLDLQRPTVYVSFTVQWYDYIYMGIYIQSFLKPKQTAVGIRYAYHSAPIISCQHGIFIRLVSWYIVLHSQFVCTCLLIFWIGYVLCTSIFLYITHMIFLSIWLSFDHVQITHRRYVYFFL